MKKFKRALRHLKAHMVGDCDYCTHSIIYHVPLFGCAKCSCSEFR
jgi:hypothetical protein